MLLFTKLNIMNCVIFYIPFKNSNIQESRLTMNDANSFWILLLFLLTILVVMTYFIARSLWNLFDVNFVLWRHSNFCHFLKGRLSIFNDSFSVSLPFFSTFSIRFTLRYSTLSARRLCVRENGLFICVKIIGISI